VTWLRLSHLYLAQAFLSTAPGLLSLLDLALQSANVLAHLDDLADARGIDPLIGKFRDLLEYRNVLIGVQAIFATLAGGLEQSSLLIASQRLGWKAH
jgi:hypothetical protein